MYDIYHCYFIVCLGDGIITFRDVCIEEDMFEVPIEVESGRKVTAKKIIIYNSYGDSPFKFTVAATSNRPDHFYWVYFNHSSIPPSHHYISDYPAYFAIPACTGNIHHFWVDFFLGLYGALNVTNRLDSHIANQLYYRDPLVEIPYDDCNAFHRYEELLYSMSIRTHHSNYHDEQPNTCYKNAVFGWKPTGTEVATKYVVDKFGISSDICKNGTVTLIQRRFRRILNMEDLKDAALSSGFSNVNIVKFEDMSLKTQIQTAYCTDILVGLHGAGLQWASFMKPGSGLLEIGWHHWDPGWYANLYGQYQNFHTTTLMAKKVILNWESYIFNVRRGEPLSDGQQYALSRRGPANSFDNHWKWADAIVDPDTFADRLLFVASRVFNKNV